MRPVLIGTSSYATGASFRFDETMIGSEQDMVHKYSLFSLYSISTFSSSLCIDAQTLSLSLLLSLPLSHVRVYTHRIRFSLIIPFFLYFSISLFLFCLFSVSLLFSYSFFLSLCSFLFLSVCLHCRLLRCSLRPPFRFCSLLYSSTTRCTLMEGWLTMRSSARESNAVLRIPQSKLI